jgi:hypothetical protein
MSIIALGNQEDVQILVHEVLQGDTTMGETMIHHGSVLAVLRPLREDVLLAEGGKVRLMKRIASEEANRMMGEELVQTSGLATTGNNFPVTRGQGITQMVVRDGSGVATLVAAVITLRSESLL